jgi:hypothetical protein
LSAQSINLTDEERKKIEEAIKQGKLVVVVYESDALKAFDVNPKDKVVLIVKRGAAKR